MSQNRFYTCCAMAVAWVVTFQATPSCGDEPEDSLKAIRLSAEMVRNSNRLHAADRLVAFQATPESAALLLGASSLGSEWNGLTATTTWLGIQIGQQDWETALREYSQMLEQASPSVIPIARYLDPIIQSAGLRTLCHLRIAEAPPAVLKAFRFRVDQRAKRWLREAREKRDAALLRRLVDDMFCSSVADEAMELLGDFAFERGDFITARYWWRRITPSAAELFDHGVPPTLQFPDPNIDLARVRAKQILASLYHKGLTVAQSEITAYKQLHGDSAGYFAAKTGNYTATLKEIAEAAKKLQPVAGENDWNTFGGRGTRTVESVKGMPVRLWADGPTWRVPLPFDSVDSGNAVWNRSGTLPYHPLIVGDRVLLADHRSVAAFQLTTGELLFRYDLKTAGHGDGVAAKPKPADAAIYTMTAHDGRLYVRLGRQSLTEADTTASYLVCLDLADKPGHELWARRFAGTKDNPEMIEGSPIVRGRRVLFTVSRLDWEQVHTSAICCDAETGDTIWTTELSDIPATNDAHRPAGTHHMMTIAGPHAFVCTHTGAFVALDVTSGHPAWAVRYADPQFKKRNDVPNGFGPPVYWNHRLYVAPADSHFLMCLDAATGELLWQRDHIDVTQLLGVGRGRLVFTTPKQLRAVDAISGLDEGGWQTPVSGSLATLGRGIMAGGWVFWPTGNAKLPVRAVTLEHGIQDGKPTTLLGGFPPTRYFDPTQLRQLRPGNMAYGNDCLVIATANELIGYIPSNRTLPLLQTNAKPEEFRELVRMAEAQLDADNLMQARSTFRLALEVSSLDPQQKRRAQTGLVETLWRLGERTTDFERIAEYLSEAASPQFPIDWRLRSLVKLAMFHQVRNETDKANAIWKRIADDETLRNGTLMVDGIPHVARPFAQDNLNKSTRSMEQASQSAASTPSTHVLHFPLDVDWTIETGQALAPHDNSESDRVFLLENTSLVCRRIATSGILWNTPLPFKPTWSACVGLTILVAGTHDLAAFRIADGAVMWRIHTTTWRNALPAKLGPFMVAHGRCYVLVNHDRLVTLSPATGRVAWAKHLRTKATDIDLHGDSLIIKSNSGLDFVDVHTGKLQSYANADSVIDAEYWCKTTAHELQLIHRDTGRIRWRFPFPYPESLSGRQPTVLPAGDRLLVFIPRNIGFDVECLSKDTGKRVWKRPTFRGGDVPPRKRIHVDAQALYLLLPNGLEKIALADGTRLWRHPLDAERESWSLKLFPNALALMTTQPTAPPLVWGPAGGGYLGYPSAQIGKFSQPFTVRFVNENTGKTIQELRWPIAASNPIAFQAGDRLVVSNGGHTWSLRGAIAPSSEKKLDSTNLAAWETGSILVK